DARRGTGVGDPSVRALGGHRGDRWRLYQDGSHVLPARSGIGMGGIAGIVNLDGRPLGRDEVAAEGGALTHRGPDVEGFYLGTGVGLGMRRLSIIDLETGHQPISNEDGTVWVVFNGEIYNFRELRDELVGRGHTFATNTDTEAIAHLYE